MDDCPDHIWIACGEQIRLPDGSVTQHYWLRSDSKKRLRRLSNIQWEAYYRLTDGTTPAKGYCKVPLECSEGAPHLKINCRTNARLELIVVGRCGGKHFSAQLRHALFGKASAVKQNHSMQFSDLPADLRQLNLQPASRNYYMQTGGTYRFTYRGDAGAVLSVAVLEEGQRLPLDLNLSLDETLAYTPAHDPRLDRSGPYEFKETVLLAREVSGDREYAATYTLQLHRSYIAHRRLFPGLVVLAGAAALIVGLVAVFKRRPWYR